MKKNIKDKFIAISIILSIIVSLIFIGQYFKVLTVGVGPIDQNSYGARLISSDGDSATYYFSFSAPGGGGNEFVLNQPQEFDFTIKGDGGYIGGQRAIPLLESGLQLDTYFSATIKLDPPLVTQFRPNNIGGVVLEYSYSDKSSCKVERWFEMSDNGVLNPRALLTCRFIGTITCKPIDSAYTEGGDCTTLGIPGGTAEVKIYKEGVVPPQVQKLYFRYNQQTNQCSQLYLFESEKTADDFVTLGECEAHITTLPPIGGKSTYYRYDSSNEVCNSIMLYPNEKTSSDFITLNECEENIKKPIAQIVISVLVIIILIIFSIIRFVKKRR